MVQPAIREEAYRCYEDEEDVIMKWNVLLSAMLIACISTACQRTETGAEAEGPEREVAVPNQQRQATMQSIDSRISDLNEEIASLESQAQSPETPAEAREDIQDDVQEAREDLQEANTHRANIEQATNREQYNRARAEVWEELRSVDLRLTEARLEAPNDLETFRKAVQEEKQKLDMEVSRVEDEADRVDQSERSEYDRDLAALREHLTRLDSTLARLDSAAESDWRNLRSDISHAFREAKIALYDVRIPGTQASGTSTTRMRPDTSLEPNQPL